MKGWLNEVNCYYRLTQSTKNLNFLKHTGGYLAITMFTDLTADGGPANFTLRPLSEPGKGRPIGEALQATLDDMVNEGRITRVCLPNMNVAF